MNHPKRALTIEVLDFWKAISSIAILAEFAHLLALDTQLKLIYHAPSDGTDMEKLSILEETLRKSGMPFEMDVVFSSPKEIANHK